MNTTAPRLTKWFLAGLLITFMMAPWPGTAIAELQGRAVPPPATPKEPNSVPPVSTIKTNTPKEAAVVPPVTEEKTNLPKEPLKLLEATPPPSEAPRSDIWGEAPATGKPKAASNPTNLWSQPVAPAKKAPANAWDSRPSETPSVWK